MVSGWMSGTTPKTVKRVFARHECGGAPPTLQGPDHREAPVSAARAAGYKGPARNLRRLVAARKALYFPDSEDDLPAHGAAAPTTAAAGRVKLQASAIRPATPQLTDGQPASRAGSEDRARAHLGGGRGSPRWVDVRITAALVVSAAKPWTG